MADMEIPFNKPFMTGQELEYIREAHRSGALSGNGRFSRLCEELLAGAVGCSRALLTHSCTGALEMSALLLDLEPGDEVIMPAYTFVSTANAFALRGAKPVFVDIRPDTLNIDETLIEAAITPQTRAICVVHYAGVACEMDAILALANKHGLAVVEDAAQATGATYKSRALGGLGRFGTLSFHETKNITCGEGGALLIRDEADVLKAEIIHEKGTDRSQFTRGMVDKYTWRSLGSSFLLGEMAAAALYAQLQAEQGITQQRLAIWDQYHNLLEPLEAQGHLRRPIIPAECRHNAHMYYILLPKGADRGAFIRALAARGVNAVFHYVPLHTSEAGQALGRVASDMSVTEDLSERLVRLPLWIGMNEDTVRFVVEAVEACIGDASQ